MRKLLIITLSLLSLSSIAQTRKYSTFYEQRATLFDALPITSEDIVFVGNSITNGGEWHELFEESNIKNRGISGDITEGIYDRLDNIVKGQPAKMFLMLGTNDISRNIPVDTIASTIEKIVSKIQQETPKTEIYLQSVLPVNPDFGMFSGHMKPNTIKKLNLLIQEIAKKHHTTFIDLYPLFLQEGTDKLSPEFTNDGLHLLGKGYVHWAEQIKPYVKEQKMNTSIERLPDYPITGGVSAPYSGVINNTLVVVGGCNFPNRPASEGGEKVFYSEIYYLDSSNQWKSGGNLPFPSAYGAYVTTSDALICIGGQNDSGLLNKVVSLSFNNEIQVKSLPDLPVGIFNGAATLVDNTIYVVGGTTSDAKPEYLYALDLSQLNKGWIKIKTNLKEERQQPVVFSQNGDLFMAGGYDERQTKVFSDVLKFDFSKKKWQEYTEINIDGKADTFIGASSINDSNGQTLFVGGVNYDIFYNAIKRIKRKNDAIASGDTKLAEELIQLGKEYMSQTPEAYKFRTALIAFDAKTKQWNTLANYLQLARAGAGVAGQGNSIYIICGETKPGVRTAEVNKIQLQ